MAGNFNKLKNFIKKIINEVKEDDLISAANDMTYKLFFSIFPFLIFLMSVVGFLKLDSDKLTAQISSVLPYSLAEPVQHFIKEITRVKSANILSFPLIVSVYGASAGFRTAMRSINKAYGQKDTRKIYIKIPISMALVLIFTVIIIISLFHIFNYAVNIIIMFFSVVIINKLALYKNKKVSVKSLVPGTFFTVFLWFVISRGFNIYIDNFTNYSALYGSIAAVIIFMLWLNIMCVVLLLGSEINAMCDIN